MQKQIGINSISIIGSGNVAWHLAHAFYRAGLDILHVISRNVKTSDELARNVQAEVRGLDDHIQPLPDLFILCVSDDAIPELVKKFTVFEKPIVHTSGTTGIEVFSEYTNSGVLYPLQTFTKGKSLEYEKIPFFIEANIKELELQLIQFAKRVSFDVRPMDSIQRRKVHMAAVFACNFSNHMMHIAEKMLEEMGIGPDILLPLIAETYSKAGKMDAGTAQTGPAVREDMATLEKHLELLEPGTREYDIYKMVSENIIAYKKNE